LFISVHFINPLIVPIPPLNLTIESVEETTIVLSWTVPMVPATILYYQVIVHDNTAMYIDLVLAVNAWGPLTFLFH